LFQQGKERLATPVDTRRSPGPEGEVRRRHGLAGLLLVGVVEKDERMPAITGRLDEGAENLEVPLARGEDGEGHESTNRLRMSRGPSSTSLRMRAMRGAAAPSP